MKWISMILLIGSYSALFSGEAYWVKECAPRKKVHKNGLNIVIRTTCDDKSTKWVSEYYKTKRHGEVKTYYPNGKLWSIHFYKNGLESDSTIIWDSLGNIGRKKYFRDGIQVGGDTSWFSNGKLKGLSQYNDKGQYHGLQMQWYDETHLEYEEHFLAGIRTSVTGYYRNGNLRYKLIETGSRTDDGYVTTRVVQGESWSWSGKSISKIINGNGNIIMLPTDFNNLVNELFPGQPVIGYEEEYRDSVAVKLKKLDSLAILQYK
jgi:antitoxin component YwqK of YwqJK toxin-antitoxin module